MYQILLIIGCCVGLIGVVRPEQAGEVAPTENRKVAREELKKLQGTWERVTMEVEGKQVPNEDLKEWLTAYKADQVFLKVDGTIYRSGVITLNPTRKPKAINTWDSDGPFRDQTLAGIYELDGDTLKVCFAKPGEPRPTEFTTERGTGFIYCVQKRLKPPADAHEPKAKEESPTK